VALGRLARGVSGSGRACAGPHRGGVRAEPYLRRDVRDFAADTAPYEPGVLCAGDLLGGGTCLGPALKCVVRGGQCRQVSGASGPVTGGDGLPEAQHHRDDAAQHHTAQSRPHSG
jgi:hypothetical protein